MNTTIKQQQKTHGEPQHNMTTQHKQIHKKVNRKHTNK